ncbi:MAG TPA: tetratricopeptide repeat protein, partial [Iamia sp.]|nr:tetratricopeptide repeat protein [Iamia sp.]
MVAEDAPDDVRVLTAQGSLALSRHEFADALDLGQRALAAAPGNETAYGVLVDALNELGRYDEALEATQAMADVRPGLAALSRVSYARELRGDLDGAIEAMTQAATAGSGTGGENLAFTQALLGNLLLTRGDVRQAERQYDLALATFPALPAAEAGRARLLVAQERYDEAADVLAGLVERQPLIEYAIAHGDALAAAGRSDEADDAYGLVEGIAALQEANGVQIDVDLALFDAEQDPGDEAVAQARRGLEQ